MKATLDFFLPVSVTVNNVFQQRLEDREQRKKVADALMSWLTLKARKKPVPDLSKRLSVMQSSVEAMVENLSIEIVEGKPVVKTAGSAEDTLKMFRLGTNWFDPNPDLTETILSGLFSE